MKFSKFLKDLFNKKPKLRKTDLTRRFDLIARVGQGSMSKVWRASDTMTGKTVALKVLDREKALRFESRFIGLNKPSEGEVATQLRHPNIVRTYEHGITLDDEQYLVMEFVEGVGLGYLIEMQNDVMQENRLRFIVQMGKATEYFHRQNWIHRDLCPRNVLIDRDHQVKLIDFGLVVPNTAEFQKPGNRTGTPSYMAPELIKRQKTDQRIDVFAYAVSCYEMYANRLPWDAAETFDTVLQHINRPPTGIREHVADIDDQIADTIMRGLALNPKDRWPSITAMLSRFQKVEARLSGVVEPEPVLDQPAADHKSTVTYWQPEEEEYEEAQLVKDDDGEDDDDYEEVGAVLDD